ncbi:Hemerythrin HHE cation binding domain protein [Streptomyces sp. YIM 121038]|uniref:hemerythrin domain-containing protein n=1 Tax=Streptomyces sp. YIM 121038 TaxID=2136401 RepID=UPI001110EC33|nr:hemerythrin domain-containing protein [Streptomyces sp. YIM 121038]QCX78479.1 Hemerythrin HHE cation binding domain protein [Streptomyces sp. YIM 121038]
MTNHTLAPAPDLTGIRLAHRAITGDVERLATLVEGIATSGRPVTGAWAESIATYVHRYNVGVRHHHDNEDAVLWPVIAAAVEQALTDGSFVEGLSPEGVADLASLTEDHTALDPLQDACDWAATLFGEDPARHARRLADALAAQHAALVRHVAAEERELFPVITRHVGAEDYAAAEARIRAATPVEHAPWLRAWLMSWATADDLRVLTPPGGVSPVADTVFRAYAEHEVEVFGPAS